MTKYTEEQKDFIRNHAKGRFIAELVDLFNKRYKTDLTYQQMRALMGDYKITNGMRSKHQPKRLLSVEQHKFLLANVKNKTSIVLANMLNKQFGLSLTFKQIQYYLRNHNITNEVDRKFKKGCVSFNKGTKGLMQANKTSFKKGHIPHNHRPVGSERINKDGYVEIKIEEPKRWKMKHVFIWEKVYGKVPKGKCLIFADGDKTNIKLENLILITRAQLAVINHNRLIKNDPELTKTGLIIADLISKSYKKKKRK